MDSHTPPAADSELREQLVEMSVLVEGTDDAVYREFEMGELEAFIVARDRRLLDTLQSELRDYRDKYPDADYMDIQGYIGGFKARFSTAALGSTDTKGADDE